MSQPKNGTHITRREALFLSTTAGLGAALTMPAFGSDSIKTAAHQEPGNCSTPRSAIAKTQYGKVRGFLDGGVFTFKGVPYGATTAGENRWLPTKPPAPWTDEYPALVYGANCPQTLHPWTSIEQTFLQDWDDGWQSEDMLKLNIWTPSLTAKLPVMVYFHGGGCTGLRELPRMKARRWPASQRRHGQSSAQHPWFRRRIAGLRHEDQPRRHDAGGGAALFTRTLRTGSDRDDLWLVLAAGSKVTTLMGMPSAVGRSSSEQRLHRVEEAHTSWEQQERLLVWMKDLSARGH